MKLNEVLELIKNGKLKEGTKVKHKKSTYTLKNGELHWDAKYAVVLTKTFDWENECEVEIINK